MQEKFISKKPNIQAFIYAWSVLRDPEYKGWLKVGYTERSGKIRSAEGNYSIPKKERHKLELEVSAFKPSGQVISDSEVRTFLENEGKIVQKEFVQCSVDDVKNAIGSLKLGKKFSSRNLDFKMRPEQNEAVSMTVDYFREFKV